MAATLPLSTGGQLPIVGLGLRKIPKPQAANVIQQALQVG